MANITPVSTPSMDIKPKSFWQRPEGVTGRIFMLGLIGGGAYLLYRALPTLIKLAENTLYLVLILVALAAVIYMVLDPKVRNIVGFMYKSIMRSITGMFVQIDPIGILKSYVESLQENLSKMSRQIGILKGQKRQLTQLMESNTAEIDSNMRMAEQAKKTGQDSQVVLFTRKAARMQDSNEKYSVLSRKIDILERVLNKMYENSQILMEDTKDQVKIKEQESQIIRTSHTAMRSAMSVLSGDPDKRAMFDMAMDNINNDVATKVGEMERFMDMSSNLMKSIDLQNGVFEDEGMKMLEEWEKNSTLILSGGKIEDKLALNPIDNTSIAPNSTELRNDYDNLFK
mgnify:CR=1 FL=1